AGVRAPHRLRQARPPRPHRRPRPGRLHPGRPRRGRAVPDPDPAGGLIMATIEKRVRNGRVTYRARYRDPAGMQRSKVFARKADAQRFLNETETAKARGTWTAPALGRVLFRDWLGEWWATTTNLRASTRARDESLL